MEVSIRRGQFKWATSEKKETNCQYLVGGVCKATTQTQCKNCRFVAPTTHGEVYALRDKAIKLTDDYEELVEINNAQAEAHRRKVNDLNREILRMQVLESTHYGEF